MLYVYIERDRDRLYKKICEGYQVCLKQCVDRHLCQVVPFRESLHCIKCCWCCCFDVDVVVFVVVIVVVVGIVVSCFVVVAMFSTCVRSWYASLAVSGVALFSSLRLWWCLWWLSGGMQDSASRYTTMLYLRNMFMLDQLGVPMLCCVQL